MLHDQYCNGMLIISIDMFIYQDLVLTLMPFDKFQYLCVDVEACWDLVFLMCLLNKVFWGVRLMHIQVS